MESNLDSVFMEFARLEGAKSPCLRRKVGCVIASRGRIISDGFNTVPRGQKPCDKEGVGCSRAHCKSGEELDKCRAIHAEQQAIARAARGGHSVMGATLYVTHLPCAHCARLIVESGIRTVVYGEDYPSQGEAILSAAGVKLKHWEA